MGKNIQSIKKKQRNGYNKMKKTNFILFAIFFIVLVAWIGIFIWDYFANEEEIAPPPSAVDDKSGLANPASVFCEEQGGEIKMYENEEGQAGFCAFEDGRICEEWALFRQGECNAPEQ